MIKKMIDMLAARKAAKNSPQVWRVRGREREALPLSMRIGLAWEIVQGRVSSIPVRKGWTYSSGMFNRGTKEIKLAFKPSNGLKPIRISLPAPELFEMFSDEEMGGVLFYLSLRMRSGESGELAFERESGA